jgi:L-rhamnose mutarotase
MTQRTGFVLHVRPDRIEEYVRVHAAVARDARRPARRRDPQLHDLQGRHWCSGFESDDPAASDTAAQEVCTRWQDEMAALLAERVPTLAAGA